MYRYIVVQCRIWGSDSSGYEALYRMGYKGESVERQLTFQGILRFHLQVWRISQAVFYFYFMPGSFLAYISTIKMEVKKAFEISDDYQWTKKRHVLEDRKIYCNTILVCWHSQREPTFIHLSHEDFEQFKVWLFSIRLFFRITVFPTDRHCILKQLF
jgi:hypothetical protein